MNKVFVKHKGNEGKYIPANEIDFGETTFEDLKIAYQKMYGAYTEMIKELKKCYVIKKDSTYIQEINNDLHRVSSIKLFENVDTSLPLKLYEVRDGEIKLKKGVL
jgi:hypothetical protein